MKYFSRKFVATVLFGAVVPPIFTLLNIPTEVIIASIGLAGAYSVANAIASKKGTE